MVDYKSRARLHELLDRLIDGTATMNQYLSASEEFVNSDDLGVAEIARFGHDFCGNQSFWRQLRTLDDATRQRIARCLIFLETDVEFHWPRWDRNVLGLSLVSVLACGFVGFF